jgi:hypothetical protein
VHVGDLLQPLEVPFDRVAPELIAEFDAEPRRVLDIADQECHVARVEGSRQDRLEVVAEGLDQLAECLGDVDVEPSVVVDGIRRVPLDHLPDAVLEAEDGRGASIHAETAGERDRVPRGAPADAAVLVRLDAVDGAVVVGQDRELRREDLVCLTAVQPLAPGSDDEPLALPSEKALPGRHITGLGGDHQPLHECDQLV